MKRIITPIGILLVTGLVKAQLSPLPGTENYIQTKTYHLVTIKTDTNKTMNAKLIKK